MLHDIGYEQLNDFQKDVVDECLDKQSFVLALRLGQGKTVCSLTLALKLVALHTLDTPILVVMSKSLLGTWVDEIKKFFGHLLKYKIIHQEHMDVSQWKIKKKYHIYLTTSDTVAKAYKENHIDKEFIEQKFVAHSRALGHYVNYYKVSDMPYIKHSKGNGLFFSVKWSCLIVDEAQLYTNINTIKCQGISSVVTHHRWLLSGTMFDEPKVERILGYHMLLHAPNKPRSIPDTQELLKSSTFKGLNEYLVQRETNPTMKTIKINDQIISNKLSQEEEKIYCLMRQILIKIRDKARQAKLLGNQEEQRLFNSYKLVMVMYLRQAVICPLLPITSVIIDSANADKKSELSTIIINELKQLKLDTYLNNIDSVTSTRFKAVLDTFTVYKEKTIAFSCFASCLDILQYLLQSTNRPVFRMEARMTIDQRNNLIKEFSQTKDGILLLTYEMGGQGLNLQFSATVFLIDYWWNASKTKQAIGRVFRHGQMAEQINIIFYSSNCAVEKLIFDKQKAKLAILNELQTGKPTTTIPGIRMDEIIKVIEMEHNTTALKKIKHF